MLLSRHAHPHSKPQHADLVSDAEGWRETRSVRRALSLPVLPNPPCCPPHLKWGIETVPHSIHESRWQALAAKPRPEIHPANLTCKQRACVRTWLRGSELELGNCERVERTLCRRPQQLSHPKQERPVERPRTTRAAPVDTSRHLSGPGFQTLATAPSVNLDLSAQLKKNQNTGKICLGGQFKSEFHCI